MCLYDPAVYVAVSLEIRIPQFSGLQPPLFLERSERLCAWARALPSSLTAVGLLMRAFSVWPLLWRACPAWRSLRAITLRADAA